MKGVLLLVAAVFVVTMIVWMNRVARHLKKHIEQRVENYAGEKRILRRDWAWPRLYF